MSVNKLSGKREQRLEELRGQLTKSSSEDDDELLDNDFFLDVQPVLQGVKRTDAYRSFRTTSNRIIAVIVGVAEVRRRGPTDSPDSSGGQSTASVLRDGVPTVSMVAQQQQQPLQQPPVVQPDDQPANIQVQ